jgi:hypothetical protein
MKLFCIYENPTDYPGKFVVREWTIGPGTVTANPSAAFVGTSIETARGALPEGLVRIERDLHDDPVIREVWL